jgi:hypothetical protein
MLINLRSLIWKKAKPVSKNHIERQKTGSPRHLWTVFVNPALRRESNYGHTIKNDNRRLYEKRLWEIQGGQAGFETPEGSVGAIFFRV